MLNYFLVPTTSYHLTIYYLFWVAAFLTINVLWDIFTPKTRPFHFLHIQEKVHILHHAAALPSNLLIITGLINPQVMRVATEAKIPLITAAIFGLFLSIVAICPYKLKPDPDPVPAEAQ